LPVNNAGVSDMSLIIQIHKNPHPVNLRTLSSLATTQLL